MKRVPERDGLVSFIIEALSTSRTPDSIFLGVL